MAFIYKRSFPCNRSDSLSFFILLEKEIEGELQTPIVPYSSCKCM